MTDAELLSRSSRGDEAAFQVLYERHVHAVFNFAYSLLSGKEEAEDVTQECFLVLIRKAAGFDPMKAQLRTWLLGITRHLCLQHKQRHRTEPLGVDPCAKAASVEQTTMQSEVEHAVRRAVTALPEAQREAVFLFEFEGLSLKEVSSVLAIDTNAVKARLHRGREQLKRSLAYLKQEIDSTRRSNYER